ncbi:inorganic phosphate transporter [Halobacterium sp. R2-5]|uniref:inorganic phosphate transporter n=1 Tax=Halobacterium sp. R2-5 TaxID=2715751 RepID=UPI00141D92DB|nr:inorganic phosphate transporter [Halobacterium sp. R2-5]NIC00889.1 inorganic phosphate transporter [Halobacterium sp. R2-5]
MSETVFVITIVMAFAAGLFMAWAIGAVAIGGGAFAPAVGANVIPVQRAAYLLGIVGFAGALVQGASVTETVGRGLVLGTSTTPLAASIAILLSALLMALGAFGRYPIPAAFTVTGAMVGAGLALGGSPAWRLYGQFAALWVVAPVLVGALSYAIARLLAWNRLLPRYSVTIIVAAVFLVFPLLEFPFLGPVDESHSLATAVAVWTPSLSGVLWVGVPVAFTVGGAALAYRTVLRHGERETNRRLLIWLGMLVAFSGAGNQIGLAIGPLLPLLDSMSVSASPVLVVASFVLVVGAWSGAPRLIEAVGREYATLSLSRSVAALVPSFLVAQVGILYGVPVSFNEIIISAIVGSGLAEGGRDEVRARKLALTVVAWVTSLVGAFIGTYGLVSLLASRGLT